MNIVVDEVGEPQALFGWSYGALISLLVASERPLRHVIAYEPVAPSFGHQALPALRNAAAERDFDRGVEIVNREVSGSSAEYVQSLRSDPNTWARLRKLSEPLHAELGALSAAPLPDEFGSAGV